MIHQLRIKKIKYADIFVNLYIFTLCFYGLIRHFVPLNIVTDIAGGILCVLLLIRKGVFINKSSTHIHLIFSFAIACLFVSLLSCYSIRHSFLGFRNYVFYILFGFALVDVASVDGRNKITNYILFWGTAVCIIGIIQYFFMDSLPDFLTNYYGAGQLYASIDSVLITRINGTLENTIVFSTFAGMISIISFSMLCVEGKSFFRIMQFALSTTACILSYSRLPIVLMIVFCAIVYIIAFNNKTKIIRYLQLGILLIVLISIVVTFFPDTVLMSRFLGRDDFVVASNYEHFMSIKIALQVISKHPLLGIGMGTQGYTRGGITPIITDGYWFIFMLETGIPTTLLYITLIVYSAIKARMEMNFLSDIKYNVMTYCLTFYFFFSSFLNSAALSRCNYGIYWVIIALFYKCNKNYTRLSK